VNAPLKDDLLPSIAAIAEYITGETSPEAQRRVRHLIDRGLPAKKVGGRIESKRSWIDSFYAEPDPLAKPAAKRER
jgi:hypothetical protein